MSLFPLFGNDNRGKATGWSLFGDVHVTAAQHSDNSVSTIQSLNTTVEEAKQLIGNGAGFASAVAGFLGDQEFAARADSFRQLLLK